MRRNLATWLSGIPVERAVLGLVLALGLWLGSASVAQARVQRFAIVIGNNQGLPGDGALRYAESDASRMNDVLLELGSFEPVNVVLLAGKSASTLRSTLITLNDRIRATVSLPNTQVMLFVYYSGHADAENLHMGESLFGIAELAELVRGSAASFRLLILDACRSGALTRVKGGRITAPFGMPEEPRAPEEGLAFLTASSADEDAQESDALRGSFFTHALISGLLGAADGDGDGSVALDEAYRYAYESTVRATSRTLAGAQHPTFHYDFRGYGALVLTRPALVSDRRGVLRLPANMDVLIMADHADGPVIAEVGARDPNRALSLRAGVYYLRARGDAVLFEGKHTLAAGKDQAVELGQLARVEYARLVRKGGPRDALSHGLEVAARMRVGLPVESTPCLGGALGYALDLEHLSMRARASACTSGFDNALVSATTNTYDIEARVSHAWDVPHLTFELGLGAGAALFTQAFQAVGEAPARRSLAPFLSVAVLAAVEVSGGFSLFVDAAGETYFLRLEPADEPSLRASFALRSALGVAKRF